jgi:hypothetical protein
MAAIPASTTSSGEAPVIATATAAATAWPP